MTNADVIRQMTDDELYRFLGAFEVGDIDYAFASCNWCGEEIDCATCFRRWLFGDANDYKGLLADKGINSGYADRKTENSSEKPNNCEDLQDWKDRMWAEAIVTEPTISKMEQVDMDTNVRCKDEPQTDYTPDCPFCKRYGTDDCLGFDCRHYKTYKDEPLTKCDLCKREGDDICLDCERKKQSGKE